MTVAQEETPEVEPTPVTIETEDIDLVIGGGASLAGILFILFAVVLGGGAGLGAAFVAMRESPQLMTVVEKFVDDAGRRDESVRELIKAVNNATELAKTVTQVYAPKEIADAVGAFDDLIDEATDGVPHDEKPEANG